MTSVILMAVLALALAGAAICLALRLILTHDLYRPETGSKRQRSTEAVLRRQ